MHSHNSAAPRFSWLRVLLARLKSCFTANKPSMTKLAGQVTTG